MEIKGIRKPKHKKAIFMCGAAGTGKTTSRDRFLKDAGITTTFVTLNLDDIAAKTGNYETARTILNSSFDNVISEGYSFFYDGTCRNKGQILRRMGALKEQGYEIILGITYAPMKTALRRIEARTHQPLDASIAKEIYIHVQNSIEQFMKSDIPDEVYLYNNTDSTKLIYHRKNQKVYCDTPNSKFYFKVC